MYEGSGTIYAFCLKKHCSVSNVLSTPQIISLGVARLQDEATHPSLDSKRSLAAEARLEPTHFVVCKSQRL